MGDFNFDNSLNSFDLELLFRAKREYPQAAFYDVNHNGEVDELDIQHYVSTILNTWYGDVNLDGQFSSSDLVSVFEAGLYDDAIAGNSTWIRRLGR